MRPRWLEDAGRDARRAIRVLARSPRFAVAALLTLALGVGLNTAVYSVVSGTLLAPLPFPDSDRLVVLGSTLEERGWDFASLSIPETEDVRAAVRGFDEVAIARPGVSVTLTGDGPAERATATFATASFLRLLGARPRQGRVFGPEVDGTPGAHPVVVVSHSFWRTRMGERPDAVGSDVVLSGTPYTVIGVLPASFRGLSAGADGASLWLPLSMGMPFFGEDMYGTRLNRQYLGLARLRAGVSVEGVRDELSALAARLEEAHPVAHDGRGFASWELRRFFHGDLSTPLLVLFGGAVLVLVICAVNVGGLLLVRGLGRNREVALRTALGARRGRLVRQLLAEALVLALLGGLLGVLVAHWSLPLVLRTFEVTLPSFGGIAVDAGIFLTSLLAVAAVGVLFGLYPALRSTRVSPATALGSRTASAGGGPPGRRGLLIGVEVAVAVVLLVGAGLTARSLHRLASEGVGYDADGLLTLRLDMTGSVAPEEQPGFVALLLDEVRGLPGVRDAAVWGPSMLGGAHWHVGVSPPGTDPQDPDHRVLAQRLLVSPGALEMLDIRLLRGRDLTDADRTDGSRPAVVSRRLADAFWPGEDPVGRQLPVSSRTLGRPAVTVVGVAEEVRHRGRIRGQEGIVGDIYLLYDHWPGPAAALLVRTRGGGSDPGVAERVRAAAAGLNPAVPVFDVSPMTDRLRREEATPRFTATLMGIYALVAVLLALVGTAGVLAYTLRQRRRELAIRSALGAGKGTLVWMAFRGGMSPVLAGVAVGIALALGLSPMVEGILFGVSATDPPVYLAVAVLVAATSALACWLPARRAVAPDPMRVLREE